MDISPKSFYKEYFLNELFTDTYEYTLISRIGNEARRTYKFVTEDSIEYEVVIDKDDIEELYYFYKSNANKETVKKVLSINPKKHFFHVTFGNLMGPRKIRSYDLFSVKHPTKILGTVIKILKEVIGSNEILTFSSKEPSRTKLYSHIIKKYKKPSDIVITEDFSSETYFIILPTS
jgi:hypothetical protein